jgi:hypothetical protein
VRTIALNAVAAASILSGAIAFNVSAQSGTLDPHSRAVTFSVDVGPYPDEFTHPGSNSACPNAFGAGAGMSAIDRPRSAVFLEAELRATMKVQFPNTCDVVVIYTPAPGVYSPLGLQPVSGTPVMPLVRTLLHGGFETPSELSPVIVRGTVGFGMIWNAHPAPIGALTLGFSSRGSGTRFYGELERDVTRIRESEALFRSDSTGRLIPVGTSIQVAHPVWTTLRIGIEMPLR